jgi:hypothetical protein
MTGSRAGGVIAAAWATMMLLGQDGYTRFSVVVVVVVFPVFFFFQRISDDCWKNFVGFRDGIRAEKGFCIVGEPDAACIAFKCTEGPETKVCVFFFSSCLFVCSFVFFLLNVFVRLQCYQVASAMKKHFNWQMNFLQKPIAVGLQIGSRKG